MSKTVPAIERVGITTPSNIADIRPIGNTPNIGRIKFERIIELATQHEASGDEPPEHHFRAGNLAAFANALLVEAQQPSIHHINLGNVLTTLQKTYADLTQAAAMFNAIEDRAIDGGEDFSKGSVLALHFEALARIGSDIAERNAGLTLDIIYALRNATTAQFDHGEAA